MPRPSGPPNGLAQVKVFQLPSRHRRRRGEGAPNALGPTRRRTTNCWPRLKTSCCCSGTRVPGLCQPAATLCDCATSCTRGILFLPELVQMNAVSTAECYWRYNLVTRKEHSLRFLLQSSASNNKPMLGRFITSRNRHFRQAHTPSYTSEDFKLISVLLLSSELPLYTCIH